MACLDKRAVTISETKVAEIPTLSIVFFVYNEPDWIVRTVSRAATLAAQSRWRDPEVVVIDDGSTDNTGAVLDQLTCDVPLRVIHQPNQGRLLAMKAGIEAAHGDYVMILGARVLLESGLDTRLDPVLEGRTVWNAVVYLPERTSMLGTFWDALPRIFWSDYFSNPRELSYGTKDFQRYPKGTGGLLLPKTLMLESFTACSTRYSDSRHANDDTSLIQWIAGQHDIWLSPDYRCLYEPRHKVSKFIPHAFHRGLHFVDGFLRRGNPFAPVIVAFYVLSGLSVLAALRNKAAIPLAYVGVTGAAVALGASRKLPRRHLAALGVVTPVFVTAYGAGLWAGLWLLLRSKCSKVPSS